ncbi:FIP1[V]-like protein isoform X1 [Tanacetum coccineum]
MEDDDEFGDLYADVLPAVTPSSPPPPQIDLNTTIANDDEETLHGVNSSKPKDRHVSPDDDLDDNFGIEDTGDEIPGLFPSEVRVSGGGVDNWDDDDDSDSEDDLQIVLNNDNDNNNNNNNVEVNEGGGGGDGEGNFVILGDNDDSSRLNETEEMQDWGEDGGGDGKVNSGVGGVVVPKIGYSGYRQPFHSQFKYVRPGAAPIPGAAPPATGGAPGQVRPPATMPPFAVRGPGDWRPGAMQKNFHSGQGIPGWGTGAPRGLDFTLPSHKTIFEVDIDGFEEKPWRLEGIDISDFFNFGLDEESWKGYCKQLDQLRLETTMQSKIRVYESGRAKMQHDPDLPPELAAATGIDEISSENQDIGKANMHSDLANGSSHARMQLPYGRAIPVETGFRERIPTIDTRPLRPLDLDAIIEIVLQGSADDDPVPENDIADPPEVNHSRENPTEDLEVEENTASGSDHFERIPKAYKGKKREVEPRKKRSSPYNHNERPTKRRTPSRSPYSAHDESIQDKELADSQKEGSPDNAEVKQSSSTSRPSLGTQEFSQNDAIEDEVVRDDIAVDTTTTTTTIFKDEKQARTMNNPKGISRTTRFSVEKVDNGEDPKAARSRNHHKSDRHREWDSNSAYHPKSKGFRRRNGRESEGAWQDEDLYLHAERTRDENIWKRERVEEMMSRHPHKVREYERSDKDRHYSKKESENGSWKGNRDSLQTRHNGSGIHEKRIKEGVEKQRDRNEWKERVRSGDKTWIGHSRLKEDYRGEKIIESREKQGRRDRIENESFSRHAGREGAYSHGNRVIDDERRSRYERVNSDSDMQRVQEKKHKESIKKGRERDSVSRSSLAPSKKNREDHSIQRSDRMMVERENGGQNHRNRQSSRKHREDVPSEDEDSKRGRSKLERWTSHKDIDLSAGVNSSASHNVDETDRYEDVDPIKPLDQSSKPQEIHENFNSNPKSLVEENGEAIPAEGKHLDAVEKLKKRSERFKLPMSIENEDLAVNKIENELLPPIQGEPHPDLAIKPERPPRKRSPAVIPKKFAKMQWQLATVTGSLKHQAAAN